MLRLFPTRIAVAAFSAARAVLAQAEKVEIIIDAGSTGSRMYVFHSNTDGVLLHSKIVGKKKPGLSSFAEKPEGALQPLQWLFAKFMKEEGPKYYGRAIGVKIFGTAGMRLLPSSKREGVWKSVSSGLNDYFRGDVADKLQFQLLNTETIEGEQEGFFALMGVNYLVKQMQNVGQPCERHGILDLGGSSTQIAIPNDCNRITRQNSFIRSFPESGMELTRERVNKLFTAAERKSCYFSGFESSSAGSSSSGGKPCADLVRAAMEHDKGSPHHMQKDWKKLKNKNLKFIAVSGYMYVTHFARWLLQQHYPELDYLKEFPAPKLKSVKQAAEKLCLLEWQSKVKEGHEYTSKSKLPHRCFELHYIYTLLHMYTNGCDECSNITFTEEINGSEVEWPIGAWLYFAEKAKKQLPGSSSSGVKKPPPKVEL
ncbi:unnamed protein product [Amoebophrya sp. A120]|nr:unnamed protein product [Amoebophrya sp. A120]|eukprot:GSA120T00023534001.1